jgi:iron-sulfur cluster assembly protein
MITLTKIAAAQIAESAHQSGAGNLGLRIAAKINDAGMLEFGMGFDEERSNDTIVESYGVTLLVHPASADLLKDITIDYSEVSPGESRFVFMLPDQEGGCGTGGCGNNGGSCGSGECGSDKGA